MRASPRVPEKRQVAVIGLDCATPQLVFDRYLNDLPNLKRLVEGGVYGWLVLHEPPREPTSLEKCKIDWSRTRAWGEGGYCARVFMNVQGREPQGIISPADYEKVRDELKAALEAIPDHKGRPIGTRALKPQEIYRTVGGVPPDLIVYWGDLDWRSVGQVGTGQIHTFENDTGPDDANHDYDGIFVAYDSAKPGGGRRLKGLHLMDVAPTVLSYFRLEPEADVQGKRITW